VLWAGGEVLVVDPGPDDIGHLEAVARAATARGRVVAVLLTHHHVDHAAGAPALADALDAPLWGHPHREMPPLDRRLGPDEALPLGGDRLVAVHTPGHAADHLCYHWPARQVLLTGDLIAGEGYIVIDPPEGDMALYLDSLRRVAALRPSLLLPGHGPEAGDATARIEAYIGHRLAREAKVLEAVRKLGTKAPGDGPTAAGGSEAGGGPAPAGSAGGQPAGVLADALLPLAYADTPPPLWPLARRSLIAHLAKLERDGLVSVSPGDIEPRYRPA
jgi:glyoxylase-like metal-dependent hydrolase (beta-lactamase superfamily II)